jgi:hypothetical protein
MNNSFEYREVRPDGVRNFNVNGLKLSIEGRTPFKSDFSMIVSLADASPDTVTLNIRPRMFFILFYLAIIFLLSALVLSSTGVSTPENHAWQIFSVFALIVASLAIWCARKIQFTQFKSKVGIVLFDVAKCGPDASKYQSFIDAIKLAIAEAASSANGSNQPLKGR